MFEPSTSDCDNPSSYKNRKGFVAILVQAMCDADAMFTWAEVKFQGSCHDSTAFYSTSFFRNIDAHVPRDYYIAADDAYVCSENFSHPTRDHVITTPPKKLSTTTIPTQTASSLNAHSVTSFADGAYFGALYRTHSSETHKPSQFACCSTTTALVVAFWKHVLVGSRGKQTSPNYPSSTSRTTYIRNMNPAVVGMSKLAKGAQLFKTPCMLCWDGTTHALSVLHGISHAASKTRRALATAVFLILLLLFGCSLQLYSTAKAKG